MYAHGNPKTKAELKQMVQRWHDTGKDPVKLFSAGVGSPESNGTEYVEGPHYPEPHRWYAKVKVVNGTVVLVYR